MLDQLNKLPWRFELIVRRAPVVPPQVLYDWTRPWHSPQSHRTETVRYNMEPKPGIPSSFSGDLQRLLHILLHSSPIVSPVVVVVVRGVVVTRRDFAAPLTTTWRAARSTQREAAPGEAVDLRGGCRVEDVGQRPSGRRTLGE